MDKAPRSAAVLIDFENIYYFLKNHLPDAEAALDTISGMVQSLRKHLAAEYNEHAISLDAYADFDRIDESVQSDLYLLGVETHNVLGTDHKNAADMKLCIDALDIMHTRPDISSFVLVAGDRDYIPVIQYLKKRGRIVRVVGFPQKSVSGDLMTIVGPEFFIDAYKFVPARPSEPPPHENAKADDTPFELKQYEQRAIEVLLRDFGDKREIWLTPYLNKMRTELSELTDPERKSIIANLRDAGVFKIEKRAGTPNDYSVILLNRNHPAIREAQP